MKAGLLVSGQKRCTDGGIVDWRQTLLVLNYDR
jgi:hypothetical protein